MSYQSVLATHVKENVMSNVIIVSVYLDRH